MVKAVDNQFFPRWRLSLRLGLLQRFILVGFSVTVIVASCFAWLLSHQMIQQALEEAVQDTSTLATVGVREAQLSDFAKPTPQTIEIWADRLGFIDHRLNVARVKLWQRDGTVLYSDARAIIGQRFSAGDELLEAFDGEVAKEISNASAEENIAEHKYKQLLEVYYPIKIGDKVAGVLEIYRDFAPIQARINLIRQEIWGGALGVFSLLFLALFSLVHSASRQLQFMAYHDPLTDLLNRRFLKEVAPKTLSRASRSGKGAALLYIDLNRFKELNDTLGHSSGDEILIKVAQRFQNVIRPSDTLCRLGGDEFAVLVDEVDAYLATEVAQRLLQTLQTPFEIAGQRAHLEASIGIALYPTDGLDLEALMRAADVAMYRAKADGNPIAHYQAEQDQYTLERLELHSALLEAIQNDGLTVFYQPIFDPANTASKRYEALVRWNHRGTLIMPGKFIPMAEETGLISELDKLVLRKAAAEAAAFGFSVSVNLSARSLNDTALLKWVGEVLRQTGLNPSQLWLEITETALMRDHEHAAQTLAALRRMGIHTALDDFGTGYSSLAYLKKFPVDVIKMDRSFVAGIGRDAKDEEMIRSVIALAHGLNLKMLAEGVETQEQLEWLRKAGCDLMQGYSIAHPTPLEHLPSLVLFARSKN